jgi:tetratricopeptide (TPR) repeat protein
MLRCCILISLLFISCENIDSKHAVNIENKLSTKFDSSNILSDNLKQIADSLYDKGSYKDAKIYLDKLISKDTLNGEYYFKRGYTNSMLLKRKEAITDFQKSIDLNFRIVDSYFNAGINSSYDNDSLALTYFKKCLKISPNHHKARLEILDCEKRLSSTREDVKLTL